MLSPSPRGVSASPERSRIWDCRLSYIYTHTRARTHTRRHTMYRHCRGSIRSIREQITTQCVFGIVSVNASRQLMMNYTTYAIAHSQQHQFFAPDHRSRYQASNNDRERERERERERTASTHPFTKARTSNSRIAFSMRSVMGTARSAVPLPGVSLSIFPFDCDLGFSDQFDDWPGRLPWMVDSYAHVHERGRAHIVHPIRWVQIRTKPVHTQRSHASVEMSTSHIKMSSSAPYMENVSPSASLPGSSISIPFH